MIPIHILYDADRQRGIVIVQRTTGSYGFREERFSGDPIEQAWIPIGKYSASYSDTACRAVSEARTLVPWAIGHDDQP